MSTAISHFARSADNAGVVAVLPGKLSIGETTSFATCEETIRKGLKTFYEVGHALARIRDEQLYRAEFGTFREYCAQRWQMTDRHARHMIDSSEAVRSVVEQLGPGAPLPATESQARPLATLPPAKRGAAWDEAVKSAPAGKVTAKHVQAAVDKRRPQKATKETKWPEPDKNGEYDEAGAEIHRFTNRAGSAQIVVLQILPKQWIWKCDWRFNTGSCEYRVTPFRAPSSWEGQASDRAEAFLLAVACLKQKCLLIVNSPFGRTIVKSQKQVAQKMIDWAHRFLPAEPKAPISQKATKVTKVAKDNGTSIRGIAVAGNPGPLLKEVGDAVRKKFFTLSDEAVVAVRRLQDLLPSLGFVNSHANKAVAELEEMESEMRKLAK